MISADWNAAYSDAGRHRNEHFELVRGNKQLATAKISADFHSIGHEPIDQVSLLLAISEVPD